MNAVNPRWYAATATILLAALAWLAVSASGPDEATADRADEFKSISSHHLKNRYVVAAPQGDACRKAVAPKRSPRTMTLTAEFVRSAPVVDGRFGDHAWSTVRPITTLDAVSQRPITLRAVHDGQRIYLLVSYPDSSPSLTHKSYRWDEAESVYKPMGDREDTFVFAWSLQGADANMRLTEAEPHRADVWFWKACRTDPVGYADDKWRVVSTERAERAVVVGSVDGQPLFLQRIGDAGRSAYVESIAFDYRGPYARRFANRAPVGSRADVRAKGRWADGVWSIEFARKLNTGHEDDVAFAVGSKYRFDVSCYEMAGGESEPGLHRPMYKAGDGFDPLILEILGKDRL